MKDDLKSLRPLAAVDRRGFITTTLATGFAAAVRPAGAQTITTDTVGLVADEVGIPVADGELPAYRARPATGRHWPVILVVQEIFGVHEHIKDVCRRFAKLGFLAVAPELFARQGNPAEVKDIQALMRDIVARVPDAQVMADLDAAVAWARAEGAHRDRLAVTGFCWGGRITWLYAAHSPEVDCGIAWYGRLVGAPSALQPLQPVDVAAKLNAPVLGLYAGRDGGIPLDTVETMRAALRAPDVTRAARDSEIVVYPEAQHGFYADYRPAHRREDADAAFARARDWLARHGLAPA